MKVFVICLIIAVALVVPSYSISCRTERERCNEEETCCVEFGPVGRCRALLKEGERCELTSLKSRLHKHVFMMKCPCGNGLKCEEDDSGSILQGTCVQN